ncbi:MAG: oligosaccharide flippase family protein [Gammaproteobacteria bacterium]|nr:MAG: oligosaccharide flippase family protein [Gammaproteobacteria bacterium]
MSGFARNVLMLGGGNVCAQIISILAVPVITRIYGPEQFGAFSFVFSLVAVIFPISTLRFNSAMLLPKDERTAADLLLLSIASVVATALLVMPALALILHRMNSVDESARAVLWFLVAGVLVHGLVHCLEFWLLRQKQFGVMAWGTVAESVTDRLFVITIGLAQHGLAAWLALGRVVGGAAHLLVFQQARTDTRLSWRDRAAHGSLRQVLQRYREFPLYQTWAYLFANGGRELPTLIFAGVFSATVAGMYALGVRVLGFPMLLIGDAVARVFYRYAIDLSAEPARLRDSTHLLVRAVFYLMFPPMLLLLVLGPQLFRLVFGPEWVEAGWFAQVLSLSFLVSFLCRVLSIFFDIFGKQRMRLAFDAAQLIGRVGAMLLGALGWGVEGAVWGLLMATVLVHGAAVVYLLSLIGLTTTSTVSLFAQALLNILPLSALLLAAGPLFDNLAVSWPVIVAGITMQTFWLARREPRLVAYAREWVR